GDAPGLQRDMPKVARSSQSVHDLVVDGLGCDEEGAFGAQRFTLQDLALSDELRESPLVDVLPVQPDRTGDGLPPMAEGGETRLVTARCVNGLHLDGDEGYERSSGVDNDECEVDRVSGPTTRLG